MSTIADHRATLLALLDHLDTLPADNILAVYLGSNGPVRSITVHYAPAVRVPEPLREHPEPEWRDAIDGLQWRAHTTWRDGLCLSAHERRVAPQEVTPREIGLAEAEVTP